MNKFLFGFFICVANIAIAQNTFTYQTQLIKNGPAIVIDFSEPQIGFEPKLQLIEAAQPATLNFVKQRKIELDIARSHINKKQLPQPAYKKQSPMPVLETNFNGNISQGTPNDNDIAVSNAGMVMSAVNSNVNIFDENGNPLQQKTLSFIANSLKGLNRTFDPRVIYDPKADRFILVFLQGSTSEDTRIITGFSQTNDATGKWNFYAIPGNVFGDSSWSDYPIISLSENELFITVNRLKDNTGWKDGFIESLIWQVELKGGYGGDSLVQRIYKDIKFNDKPIWSVCPAKGGEGNYGPSMYFLSVRPSDLTNDTIFMHEITNTIQSNNAELKTRILRLPQPYGLQPNAFMPNGKKLQTNDARVLSAMYHEYKIHFVGNCINQSTFDPGIYYGVITNPWENNPAITGRVISYDTMDIGYPSISHMGGGKTDHSALITFSYSSPRSYPGTAAIFLDRNGDISDPLVVKAGLGNIQLLNDSVQRWGDYTGNQRQYNKPGISWVGGSYGGQNGGNQTWIAKIKSNDPLLSVNTISGNTLNQANFFPNPVNSFAKIEFDIYEATWVEFVLFDQQGRMIQKLLRDKAKAGRNEFSINTHDLNNGIYFIQIITNNEIRFNQKIVVQH